MRHAARTQPPLVLYLFANIFQILKMFWRVSMWTFIITCFWKFFVSSLQVFWIEFGAWLFRGMRKTDASIDWFGGWGPCFAMFVSKVGDKSTEKHREWGLEVWEDPNIIIHLWKWRLDERWKVSKSLKFYDIETLGASAESSKTKFPFERSVWEQLGATW